VKLTSAQLQKLEATHLANIIRKLASGKTLTKREQEILDRQKKAEAVPDFYDTKVELAAYLGRSRRTLQNWCERFKDAPDLPKPRADGRHSGPEWRAFMLNHELTNEPDVEEDGQQPKAHWDRERSRVDFERALFSLETDRRKHVELDEICGAVGQMLAGFRTAINMLPGSAARWLIGLKDFHEIKEKLESETQGVLQSLGRCRYMEDLAPDIVEKLFKDKPPEYRDDVKKSVAQVFIEIGREGLTNLMQQDFVERPPSA
jgi:hypothetical protein